MGEVSCRVCNLMLEVALERGGSAAELLDGLSFTVDDLRKPRDRVSWDDFTVFLGRCSAICGGLEATDEIAAQHVGQPWPKLMRALAGGVSSAAALYALAGWNGPATFTCTSLDQRRLSSGRILQTVEIFPGFRDSPEFFYMMRGIIRAVPRLLGQDDAIVKMRLGPNRASYEITPPMSRTWWSRTRRRMSLNNRLTGDLEELLTGALEELNFQESMLRESEDQNRRTAATLAEKSRQLDSLNELGRRLAQHLSLDELATAVTKLLEEHFKVGGLAFWVLDVDGDRMEEVRRSGETSGEPSHRIELRAEGKQVGGLWIWQGGSRSLRTEAPPVEALAPWIGLAVGNARSFEALSRQTHRLEREVEIRKRTEQQLFQAQKLEALGVLAGGIAHDFNNILTAIRGYAELAMAGASGDDSLRGDLDEIRIAADRASALVSRLLLFSRRQIQELQHVDVNEVIAGIESLLRQLLGETIDLEIASARDLPPVLADPAQLEQVIVNLIVNSRDALPGGGRVCIRTSLAPAGAGSVVRLAVEDNGSGMSDETRTKIFEPFFTTKAPGQGSGLGLSTVYGIVSQSGGSVDVRSELGRGTTVVVELPASEDENAMAEEPTREAAGARGSETILLVEDDAQVLEVARQILERHGYRVIACGSSPEALEQCQAGFERIDVLVADVVMPHMNGIELGRRARPLLPNLRNVWVSGYAQDDLRGDRELDGIFLRKPFSSESLLHAVRRALATDPEGGDKPDGEPA